MTADSLWFPKQPGRPFLLAADIDGTLLGDEAGETALRAFAGTYRRSFRLAYVTGRYRSSVEKLVEEGRLSCPDFICSNVGSDIHDLNDPKNLIGRKYAAQVGPEWDLETIYRLGVGEGVTRQDFSEEQPPYQAGFTWDGQAETLAAFHARLAGLDRFRILASYGEFIDVLPGPLGKGRAVEFLQRELGISPQRVVVAGDSGNDREMFETGFRGILPVNALDELKAVARPPRHYQSSFPAGRGVLDGLEHFGFVAQKGNP